MKKQVLAIFVFLAFLQICSSQPTNINISNTNYFNGEPYMAINPTNPKNIIIAYYFRWWTNLDKSNSSE
ncbi:MAG TPA: hypothetical protein VNG53_03010 [Bacteroidia bacterium]|nr:hypothetical protein [Bacteroidia bacterium]